MIDCPVCPGRPAAKISVGSNCFRCDVCDELVFAINNPFNGDLRYAAISNVASLLRAIPDDILLQKIVDQSPISDPPNNMIIEFDGGASALIIQPLSEKNRYTKRTRKSLNKTAFVLKHNLLHVYLPVELIERIRTSSHGKNA